MSIPYTAKVNEQGATPVINEVHTIGILGTATFASGNIRLIQVPQGPAPAVTIPGYVEILAGSPTGVQFIVNYTTGVVSFDPSNNGMTVVVSLYQGLGSEIAAEDVNELQNPVSTVAQQTIVYNWPSAPSVSWSLAPNIVTNASISNTAAISLTKLQALNSSIVPVTNGSGVLTSSSVTVIELGYVSGVTSPIQTQLNSKQTTGNYITALTGDVTASGPGSTPATVVTVGGSTASAVNTATVAANAATSIDTFGTIVKRDGSGSFAVTSITFKNQNPLILEDAQVSPNSVNIEAPATISASYTLKMPTAQGSVSSFLQNDGFGNLSWTSGGSGFPGGSNGDLQYNNSGGFGGATITTNGNTLQFPNPVLNQLQFLDNLHASLGADPTANTLYLFGPTLINLATINSNVFVKDNGFNIQITTNPSGIPDPSATLDLSTGNPSNFLGFLPPKMTTAQRDTIGTPAAGTATVVDYTMLSGAVLTVAGTPLTEGVDWFAMTDNTTTATSLASAINALASVNATFVLNLVNIVGQVVVGSDSITLATSDATNLPVSGPFLTGEIDPSSGLMIYNTDNNQWNGWNGTNWAIIG